MAIVKSKLLKKLSKNYPNFLKNDLVKFLLNLNIVTSQKDDEKEETKEILKNNKKVGRNEKCPCGSGKKHKHCCGSI